jgi:hypothetical protein
MSGKDYITSKISLVDVATNVTLLSIEVKTSTAINIVGKIQSLGFMQTRSPKRWLRRAVPSDASRGGPGCGRTPYSRCESVVLAALATDGLCKALDLAPDAIACSDEDALGESARQALLDVLERCGR